ncbi:hypothetical protein C8K66_11242 [Pseudomonas sp. GV105]|nr:hypothetical protein C8K66_11242 [Pseudomonas sp. GV105]
MLAKIVNDHANILNERGALAFFASKLAPTVICARLTKRPLSYSKTAARGRRLVHCTRFYSAVAGSAFGAGFGSDDRNAMINAATYGSDCTSSITTQKRMSALGRPCTR